MPLRIEHPRGGDVALVPLVGAGVVARDEDGVVAGRVQPSESLVGQLGGRQHRARLQGDIAQLEDLVVGHDAALRRWVRRFTLPSDQKKRRYSSTSHWEM